MVQEVLRLLLISVCGKESQLGKYCDVAIQQSIAHIVYSSLPPGFESSLSNGNWKLIEFKSFTHHKCNKCARPQWNLKQLGICAMF